MFVSNIFFSFKNPFQSIQAGAHLLFGKPQNFVVRKTVKYSAHIQLPITLNILSKKICKLTVYHVILTFNDLIIKSLLKTLWEKVPTMFSTLSKTKKNTTIFLIFILSPANSFNMDQSRILSFGKRVKR